MLSKSLQLFTHDLSKHQLLNNLQVNMLIIFKNLSELINLN